MSMKSKKTNKKNRTIAAILVAIGVISLLGAGGWYAHLLMEDKNAERASAEILESLEIDIYGVPETDPANGGTLPEGETYAPKDTEPEETLPPPDLDPEDIEMETATVNDTGYIGIIEIPSASLSLPVAYDWDYEKLKISPCRFHGSYYTDDLVICAHDYGSHFRAIRALGIGDTVVFTAMNGESIRYVVTNVETVQPTAVEQMINNIGENSEKLWDLTLFTCNVGGMTRCAVRCERAG